MNQLIAIIAGEPNSINSEIIAKAWKKKKKLKNIFVIGNYSILNKQMLKLGIKIPLAKIKSFQEFKKIDKLLVLDVPLKFKSEFSINPSDAKIYIFKCFDEKRNQNLFITIILACYFNYLFSFKKVSDIALGKVDTISYICSGKV